MKNVDGAYAIVRVDLPLEDSSEELRNKIAVKRIVWSLELAETEVERLNAVNTDKSCRYFWTYTRVDKRSQVAAES